MNRRSDPISEDVRSLLMAVGVHLIALGLIVSGISWTQATTPPPSVEGEMIEVAMLPAPAPPKAAKAKPVERPKPPEPEPAKPKEEPKPVVDDKPPTPPAPPPGKDTVNQEEVSRLAIAEKAKADREQQERIKREQELLEQHQKQVKMEEEKAKQLEDIRRDRLRAEEKRKQAERDLAMLKEEQTKLSQKAPPKPDQPPAPKPGNNGSDDDLTARYRLAINQQVDRNWLRPDNLRPNTVCIAEVIQIVGGEVISVDLSKCDPDPQLRQSIESALYRQPMPYEGYQSVFRRKLSVPFCFPLEACQR